jgi:hypothetical protein
MPTPFYRIFTIYDKKAGVNGENSVKCLSLRWRITLAGVAILSIGIDTRIHLAYYKTDAGNGPAIYELIPCH